MGTTLDLVFAAIALAIGGSLCAQQTLTVGPGQTYATLGAAIAAAAPGDTVLAVGGSYQENVDIDKPLQLVGQGALMRGSFPPVSIRVHDLGPNEAVVVRGFTLESGSGFGMPIQVEDCEGPVALHEFTNQGGVEFWSLSVAQSSQVHAARSLFYSVRSTDAVLSLEQCVIDPATWVPALWAQSSAVALVQCTLHGPFVPGGAAVWLDGGGSLLVTRSSLTATASITPMPAIQAIAGGEVLVDPSTSLGSTGGAPAVTGTVPVSFEFASLRASSNGSVLTATAHGPANEVFVTVFSALAPAVATPLGLTWLDLATFTPLYAGIYDPSTRTHTATIAHPPAPPGLAFALQAIGLGSNGLSLGLPTMLTMP